MAARSAAPSSEPGEAAAAPNAVARVSQWADDHLRLVWVQTAGHRRALGAAQRAGRAAARGSDGDSGASAAGRRGASPGTGPPRPPAGDRVVGRSPGQATPDRSARRSLGAPGRDASAPSGSARGSPVRVTPVPGSVPGRKACEARSWGGCCAAPVSN